MKKLFKIFSLTIIIILNLFITTFGQQSAEKVFNKHLTVADINKICNSIDKNKNLSEGIREGETLDKKGGFDTYYLQDKSNKTLYRIIDNISTNKFSKTIFYYNNKKVIKAIVTITNYDSTKFKYFSTYYFDNNKLIKKVKENMIYSNFKDILKQGLNFQEQFYNERRRRKTAYNSGFCASAA